MRTNFFLSILLLFVMIFSAMNCSKSPKFDHYGVYVKGDNGFKEIKGYEWSGWDDVYQNSRNYDKTEVVFENVIEIYVYSPKAKLTDYKLIIPNNISSKGDFKCDNYGYGYNCPEAEFAIEPIKKKDDMIKILSKTQAETLILHIKEESKGYVFNAKYNETPNGKTNDKTTIQSLSEKHLKKYKKEISKTINIWIALIKEKKYKEFVVDFKNPIMLNELKVSGDYEFEIEDTIEDIGLDNGWGNVISQLERILQETPIVKQDHISFNNSSIELCRINGNWHQFESY